MRFWVTVAVVLFSIIIGSLIGVFISSEVVEVNLVNANADLAGGKIAWQFKVNGEYLPAGKSVRVFKKDLRIQVIEVKSQKKVDELNVGSLIKKGDLVTYAYYGPGSSEGENLYIHILHKDGTSREVKVNINNQ